jgi:serine/threonine-protein kinase HipA
VSRESATFEYDPAWLEKSPQVLAGAGARSWPRSFHTANDLPIFGAIGDSTPDRWGRGRVLMQRMERRRAKKEGKTPSALRVRQ